MNKTPLVHFNENLNLVHFIVNKYTFYQEKEDLIQRGYMGLFKAALKFNETLGYEFSTFAIKYIEGEIKKEIKENKLVKLPNKTYKILKYISADFSEEEIKDRLHISSRMIREAISYKALVMFDETKYIEKEKITVILTGLNEIERKIVLLKYRHNLSQKDIGRLLKVSQSTVSRILGEALRKLKNM